ncbi:MFS transporter [Dactylosporangium sp. NPDC048998]|uniref:MFS transporter n=1 Tax=Dactylosporangium sp. NPDC048998 TaxID=3363976 RepID=UPI0037225240
MTSRQSGRGDRNAVAALVFACLNASLVQTIVFPIQAELPGILGEPREITAWVVTATVASACAFAPVTGRLGDLWGRRRMAIVLLLALALGSVLAGLAGNAGMLIAGRALQGLAIGLIPLSMSIMKEVVPARQLGGAIALAAGTMGVGAALGIPLGALITRWLDWHALFWVSFALAVVTVPWLLAAVPASAHRAAGGFDWVGASGNVVGSTTLLVGLAEAVTLGWMSTTTLTLIGVGTAILVTANIVMAGSRSPLIDVRVAMRPRVLLTNALSLLLNYATMSTMVAFPQILSLPVDTEAGLGLAPTLASMIMMANGMAQALATPLAARLSSAVDPKFMVTGGSAFVGIGVLAAVLGMGSPWALLAVNVVVGVAFGVAFAAIPQIIMSAVPAGDVAAANGLNAQIRIFGTAGAASVTGAILATVTIAGQPSRSAFIMALLACIAATAIGAVLGALIPRGRGR